MTEADILRFLEEKAADSGFKSARCVIENVPSSPCAIYVNLNAKDGPTTFGFGKSFAEAIAQAHERANKASAGAASVAAR